MEFEHDFKKQKTIHAQKIAKEKALAFFNGCKFPKCLSLHCKNYIGSKSFEEMRNDPQTNLAAVLELIGENELKMECAIREDFISKLPETFQRFTVLFSLNFNDLINMTSEARVTFFLSLRKEYDEQLATEDGDFRLKTILYFEDNIRLNIDSLLGAIDWKAVDRDVFETIILFFISFRFIFEVDLFNENFEIKKIYHNINFFDLASPNIVKQVVQGPVMQILNKKNISNMNEDIQNLLTMCYPIDDFLQAKGKVRKFQMAVLCNSVGFLMHLNSILPLSNRLPIKEFTNPTLSEDLSDKQATILYIASQPAHPLLTILKMENFVFETDNDVNYMKYPFLLTVDRRVDVLNQESLLSQKAEMIGQINGNFFAMLMQNNLYLNIQLRRPNILEDALTQLSKGSNKNNLRKQLKITFVGEPGVDEGGVKKEFFNLLSQQLFDPNFGMFIEKNNRFLWFNPNSFECNLNFELVGTLLGLALYNEVILTLKFPLAVYKKLIGIGLDKTIISDQISIEDFMDLDPDIYQTLNNLLVKDWTGIDTGLFFVVSYEIWGEVRDVELIPNGSATSVTEENKKTFIELYKNWYFSDSVQSQFSSFANGFFKVIQKDSLKLFAAEDLLLAICGSTVLDFVNLQKTASYENYTANSETIIMFWNILLNDFEEPEQKEFLKFLTGSDRSPIRGLGDIKMNITKTADSNSLPSAHTCFNHLILPDYRDYEKLKTKLLKAIENSEGFGLF